MNRAARTAFELELARVVHGEAHDLAEALALGAGHCNRLSVRLLDEQPGGRIEAERDRSHNLSAAAGEDDVPRPTARRRIDRGLEAIDAVTAAKVLPFNERVRLTERLTHMRQSDIDPIAHRAQLLSRLVVAGRPAQEFLDRGARIAAHCGLERERGTGRQSRDERRVLRGGLQ